MSPITPIKARSSTIRQAPGLLPSIIFRDARELPHRIATEASVVAPQEQTSIINREAVVAKTTVERPVNSAHIPLRPVNSAHIPLLLPPVDENLWSGSEPTAECSDLRFDLVTFSSGALMPKEASHYEATLESQFPSLIDHEANEETPQEQTSIIKENEIQVQDPVHDEEQSTIEFKVQVQVQVQEETRFSIQGLRRHPQVPISSDSEAYRLVHKDTPVVVSGASLYSTQTPNPS